MTGILVTIQPASNQMKMYFSKLYRATPEHYDFATKKNPQRHLQNSDCFYIKKKIKLQLCKRTKEWSSDTLKSLKASFLCSAFLAIHTPAECEHGIFSARILYFRTKIIHLETLIKKKDRGMSWGIISRHCAEESYWSTTIPQRQPITSKKLEGEKEDISKTARFFLIISRLRLLVKNWWSTNSNFSMYQSYVTLDKG